MVRMVKQETQLEIKSCTYKQTFKIFKRFLLGFQTSSFTKAVAMGAKITSNSWGGGGSSSAMRVPHLHQQFFRWKKSEKKHETTCFFIFFP